jgi:hypothetical protein
MLTPRSHTNAAFMPLELNALSSWPGARGSFPEIDSGHPGTISITSRVRRASWNVMKPGIHRVLTQ